MCRCDTSFVLNLENEFKSILGAPADLETWAEWLQSVVNIALASVSGTTTFTKAARQFLLKWSFYRYVTSLLILSCMYCLTGIQFYIVALYIVNSICLMASKLESHRTLQILNE